MTSTWNLRYPVLLDYSGTACTTVLPAPAALLLTPDHHGQHQEGVGQFPHVDTETPGGRWQVVKGDRRRAPPAGVLEDPEGELAAGGVLEARRLAAQGDGQGELQHLQVDGEVEGGAPPAGVRRQQRPRELAGAGAQVLLGAGEGAGAGAGAQVLLGVGEGARGKALDEKLNILPLTENGNSIYFPVLIFL